MREFSPVTLRDALHFVFKHKFKVFWVTVASAGMALAYLVYVGPGYEAELKILVMLGNEKTAALDVRPNSPSFMFAERGQNVNNEVQIIKDPSLAYAVLPRIKEFLAARPISPPKTFFQHAKALLRKVANSVAELLNKPFLWLGLSVELSLDDRLALSLYDSLRYEFVEQTDVIRLSFWSSDPNFAAFALNAYADEYIRRRIAVHEIVESQDFYIEQIRTHREMLRSAEEALDSFLEKSRITNADAERKLLLEETSRLEEEMTSAKLRLADTELKRSYVRDTLDGTDSWIETPDDIGNALDLNSLDRHYFELAAERSRLRGTFTDSSREIREIEQQIAELRTQKAQSLLNFLTLRAESLSGKVAGYQEEIDGRGARLRQISKDSIRLAELERDVKIAETNLLTYQTKGEELRIIEDLSKQEITSVRIINRAMPPAKPAAPRKGLLLAVATFLGVFLGFAYAAVAEFLDHTFRDRKDVEEMLDAPLLLTLPVLPRRRL